MQLKIILHEQTIPRKFSTAHIHYMIVTLKTYILKEAKAYEIREPLTMIVCGIQSNSFKTTWKELNILRRYKRVLL
jgi:hypothetical protein